MRPCKPAALLGLALTLGACADHAPTAMDPSSIDAAFDFYSDWGKGPQIVINEVMPNPDARTDDDGEWFEVHNWGTESADLKGWVIESANDGPHVITESVKIKPGHYAVLVRAAEEKKNGKYRNYDRLRPGYLYGAGIRLANSRDWVSLKDPDGVTVDSVGWEGGFPRGATRGLMEPSMPHADVNGANWTTQVSTFGPDDLQVEEQDRGTPNHRNDGYTRPVPPGPITRVEVGPMGASVGVETTVTLTAAAYDANGRPIPTGFTWSSADETIATVEGGTVTGVAEGTVLIRATSENGVSGEVEVTVRGVVLVINEILNDPRIVSDDVGEWVEIHNPGTRPVKLDGWVIASNNDAPHTITSDASIPAGGYAVLGRNPNTSVNGGVVMTYAYGTRLALANRSDWIAIRSPNGATVDSVHWASGLTSGTSRMLIDPSQDNTDVKSASWQNSTRIFGMGDRGTPGGANDGSGGPAEPGVVATVTLSPSTAAITPGSVHRFTATARDASGTPVSTTFTWESGNTAVATVDDTGLATGVAVGETTVRATAANGVSATAAVSVVNTAVYRNHVEFGIPTDPDPSDDHLMTKTQFHLSYNAARGGANWVSWNLNSTHFGDAPRSPSFNPDPTLPDGMYRVVTGDYTGSGYTRGHMVRSEERTSSVLDNESTFLMTNILPQYYDLNGGPWLGLEFHSEDLAKNQGKELYVIAGGLYPSRVETLKNEGKVAIPSHTWKIIVVLPHGKGLADVASAADLQVIAVSMPNQTGILGVPWTSYTTTVDALEAATGYDFLAALPDDIESAVER